MILVGTALAGTLEGTVTAPDGTPEPGARVIAYDHRYDDLEAFTDDDGRWRIEDVPPASWRVRVLPRAGSAGSETWKGGALSFCSAEVVPLEADQTGQGDVELEAGGAVVGRVYRQDHTPLTGAVVTVRPIWYREVGVAARAATVADDGSFRVTGLPPSPDGRDQVRIQVEGGGAPLQFFRGEWTELDADLVDLPPAGEVEVWPFSVLPPVTVSGVVTVGGGAPSEAVVSVYDGLAVKSAHAGPDGAYTVEGLRQQPLLVWVDVPGHPRTYAPDLLAAGELLDPTTADLGHVDVAVREGGVLRGRLVGSDVWEDVVVLAVTVDGRGGPAAYVEEDGTFRMAGVPPDTWTLELYAYGTNLVEGALPGGSTLVTAGQESDMGDIQVVPAARVEGTVTDPYTGEPVYGATVAVVDVGSGGRIQTYSDREGHYLIERVPPGPWSLEADYALACEGDGDWISVRWPASVNLEVRGVVELEGGQTFTWDPPMPEDADDDGLADGWELLHGFDPTVKEGDQDPDGDGFTNLQEFRLGTDPRAVYTEPGCGCDARASDAPGVLALVARRRGTIRPACTPSSSR